jgi:hypothetical protein
MFTFIVGLLVGGVLVFIYYNQIKAVETKVIDTFETDKAELASLEAKYGAEIKNAVGTLSADAQAVVARYHELKAKVAAAVSKL